MTELEETEKQAISKKKSWWLEQICCQSLPENSSRIPKPLCQLNPNEQSNPNPKGVQVGNLRVQGDGFVVDGMGILH